MKCALEMNVVVMDACEKVRLEEEARQERIALFNERIKLNAIKFCEEVIAPALEEEAVHCGRKLYLRLANQDGWRGEYPGCASLLEEKRKAYADGRSSYSPTGYEFHLPTVVEYLRAHCYEVGYGSSSYSHYGSGSQRGYYLSVIIPKEPCEK